MISEHVRLVQNLKNKNRLILRYFTFILLSCGRNEFNYVSIMMLVIISFASLFVIVAKNFSNNVRHFIFKSLFFVLNKRGQKTKIYSNFNFFFSLFVQFDIALKMFSNRLQSNRRYAQAVALLIVCAVKLSAISSIVSIICTYNEE